jgi:pimeloyl-ACP methyl ester carboxylesterase
VFTRTRPGPPTTGWQPGEDTLPVVMSRRGRVGAVSMLLVVTLVGGAVRAAASETRSHPTSCGEQVRRASPNERGIPVLFVHGFAGAPSAFRRRLGDARSMLDVVRDIPGAVAYTFDYSAHSLEWVTDPAIGRALGRAIVCIRTQQGAPVTVVAHSMGGLATREAQGTVVRGQRAARSIARVITIGTPFEGAQLLGFADGPAGDVLSTVIRTTLDVCDTSLSNRPDRTMCDLLGATETAAVQGMIPGSAQLAALPAWADRLGIAPIAADIEVGIDGPFGFSERFSVGDFAVSSESALADASRGSPRFVAGCRATLLGLVDAIDASPCSHANELANRRIIREVRQRVERAVAHARELRTAS